MLGKIQILLIFDVLVFSYVLQGKETLSSKGDMVQNKPVVLVCKSFRITSTVAFANNNGMPVGACLNENKCMSGKGYNIYQNITRNETILTIPRCNKLIEGTWSCYQIKRVSFDVFCSDPPGTVTIKAKTTNTVTCESDCADIPVSFKLEILMRESTKFVYNETKSGIASTKTCEKIFEKRYSITFENLNEHIVGQPVAMKCYAIGTGIADSENIPHAKTTYFEDPASEAVEVGEKVLMIFKRAAIAVTFCVVIYFASIYFPRNTNNRYLDFSILRRRS